MSKSWMWTGKATRLVRHEISDAGVDISLDERAICVTCAKGRSGSQKWILRGIEALDIGSWCWCDAAELWGNPAEYDMWQYVVNDVLESADCVRVLPFLVKALAYPCSPCIHFEILFTKLVWLIPLALLRMLQKHHHHAMSWQPDCSFRSFASCLLPPNCVTTYDRSPSRFQPRKVRRICRSHAIYRDMKRYRRAGDVYNYWLIHLPFLHRPSFQLPCITLQHGY